MTEKFASFDMIIVDCKALGHDWNIFLTEYFNNSFATFCGKIARADIH